jgi:hypothetical protein
MVSGCPDVLDAADNGGAGDVEGAANGMVHEVVGA